MQGGVPHSSAPWPYKLDAEPDLPPATSGSPAAVGAAIERERPRALRRLLGQFWTPDPIAELMVRWALRDTPGRFLDPGAGPLTFLHAAERAFGPGRTSCVAFELDDALVCAARAAFPPVTCDVRQEDFLRTSLRFPGLAVVCNPPYTRHHGILDERKAELVGWAKATFGFRPSRFLGAHAWFLLKALDITGPDARLCFITPVELFMSRSGLDLFRHLPERFRPCRAIVFGPEFDAFPGVDATAAVSFFDPAATGLDRALLVLRRWPGPELLRAWLESPRATLGVDRAGEVLPFEPGSRISLVPAAGNPRRPGVPLAAYARVSRGVATGANGFFLFDRRRREASGIAAGHFLRVIARARDATTPVLDVADLEALEARGRPTHLLALTRATEPSGPLATYLAEGERLGLPNRPLISRRRPWWLTEAREAPAILFTYLSRGDPRFIRNDAKAVALTTFLVLHPLPPTAGVAPDDWITCLVATLNSPGTLASLAEHSRAYGGMTRKIEPRELERIELPAIAELPPDALRELARAAAGWLGTASRDERRRSAANWEVDVLRRLGG